MVTQPYQRAKTSKISTKRLVKRPSREAGSCTGARSRRADHAKTSVMHQSQDIWRRRKAEEVAISSLVKVWSD